ncbi:MAG: hypothetical protein ACOX89_00885 [Lutispora sp.]
MDKGHINKSKYDGNHDITRKLESIRRQKEWFLILIYVFILILEKH